MQIINPTISGPGVNESIESRSPDACQTSGKAPHVATAGEAIKNYRENPAAVWYKTVLIPTIQPAGMHSNDYVSPTSFLMSSQSSSFAGTTSSMQSALVLHAVWKTSSQRKTSWLRVQRRNLPNFSQPTERLQDWDLRTNTIRTRS